MYTVCVSQDGGGSGGRTEKNNMLKNKLQVGERERASESIKC